MTETYRPYGGILSVANPANRGYSQAAAGIRGIADSLLVGEMLIEQW
jgi:hypothetical protein